MRTLLANNDLPIGERADFLAVETNGRLLREASQPGVSLSGGGAALRDRGAGASQLAVSHPVVSRSISELEHALGVRLLEGNPRGVELTQFGRAILNRSHAAFDELRQA
jgi:hypothetical protein